MSKVFISYRREDAAGYAQAIFGHLERHLRRDQIFMDVDTLEPGIDFIARIQQAITESDVVIAVIGKRWMGERSNAPARIHDPHDFVHLEIATALSRDIKVIPVLVDGASMPNQEQLPRTLQAFAHRNALELSNTRFRFDLERIAQAVRKTLTPARRKPAEWRFRPSLLYGGASLLLIAVLIVINVWLKRTAVPKQGDQPSLVEEGIVLEKPPPRKSPPLDDSAAGDVRYESEPQKIQRLNAEMDRISRDKQLSEEVKRQKIESLKKEMMQSLERMLSQ
jgi:hypothetical protein